MKTLRAKFKALPPERLASNQSFAVRVHRALSWLDRAGAPPDMETRFILAWVAFNALYGQAREGLPTARSQPGYGGGDRNEYAEFLNKLAGLDGPCLMAAATKIRPYLQQLVGCKYLYCYYWRNMPDWEESLARDLDGFERAMESRNIGRIYSLAFDRFYIMRLQLLHGGATFNSKVNRKTLQLCEVVLRHLMRAIIEVMIEHGLDVDWGEFSYPPRDQPAHVPERTAANGAK